MKDKRLYLAVAACAVVVHIGALWNQFAMDDVAIIVWNPLVQSGTGVWRAFGAPYWPANLGGLVYRPLPVASYAIDWQFHSAAWFHAVNLLWHAGTAVAVAALARRWVSATAALAAGLIFAVHPVHVEAVASVIGRAELMAAVATCLAVYAAVARDSVAWSAISSPTAPKRAYCRCSDGSEYRKRPQTAWALKVQPSPHEPRRTRTRSRPGSSSCSRSQIQREMFSSVGTSSPWTSLR